MGLDNQRGQSTVEYIMLLAVVVALMTAVLKNDRLQDYIGKGGEFFRRHAEFISYTYRHGLPGRGMQRADDYQSYQTAEHPTYRTEDGKQKFVIPLKTYPE